MKKIRFWIILLLIVTYFLNEIGLAIGFKLIIAVAIPIIFESWISKKLDYIFECIDLKSEKIPNEISEMRKVINMLSCGIFILALQGVNLYDGFINDEYGIGISIFVCAIIRVSYSLLCFSSLYYLYLKTAFEISLFWQERRTPIMVIELNEKIEFMNSIFEKK